MTPIRAHKLCPACGESVWEDAGTCWCGHVFPPAATATSPVPSAEVTVTPRPDVGDVRTATVGLGRSLAAYVGASPRRRAASAGIGLVVLFLAFAAFAGFGGNSPTHSSSAESASASDPTCFVTGNGNQLCGSAAGAYCSLHYIDYLNRDQVSARQCDTAAPGRWCAATASYNSTVRSDLSRASAAFVQSMHDYGWAMTVYAEAGCPSS